MAFKSKAQTGGIQCSKRNCDSVHKLFGEGNYIDYKLEIFSSNMKFIDKINKILCTIKGYSNGSSKTTDNNIISLINKENITHVFIDSSLNGKLIKRIKKNNPNIKIIVFFHNCEYSLVKQDFFNGNIIALMRLYSCYLNEKFSCKYADKIISLNQRDSDIIYKYYNRKSDIQIPISLPDICKPELLVESYKNESTKIELLFIGSNFYPNIHGIKWFINNVLPKINANLTIIGRNLKGIIPENISNIRLLSNVDDISSYYYNADIIIAPLFKGSGMKVKIAEAMMYGKPIIGTTEAFQGYIQTKDMFLANNVNEFINAINSIKKLRYSKDIRDLYETSYSFEATLKLFKKVFEL